MITKISNLEDRLKKTLFEMKSVIVAYSGGVDSSYLMDVANEILDKKALAVMSFSPSVAQDDRDDAIKLANSKGWNYKIVETKEMEDENYVKNDINRCFFCKNELYSTLVDISDELNFEWVVNGSNLDDKGKEIVSKVLSNRRKRGLTNFFSTHSKDFLKECSSKTIKLNGATEL